jgi:hypothetical protein
MVGSDWAIVKAAAKEGKEAKGSLGEGEAMFDLLIRANATLPGLMRALRSKVSRAAGCFGALGVHTPPS